MRNDVVTPRFPFDLFGRLSRWLHRRDDDPPDEPTFDGTTDELLDVLKNGRRRAAVRHLDGPTEKSALCRAIADDDNYKAVYVTMHQSHLDVLTDSGIVAMDHNTIVPGPNFAAAERALAAVEAVVRDD